MVLPMVAVLIPAWIAVAIALMVLRRIRRTDYDEVSNR